MSLSVVNFPAAVVGVGVLVAAVTDLWNFKVHNLLTVPMLLSGLVYHTAVHGLSGLGASALGAVFGFLVLFTFYLMGGIGGGDVKLMAANVSWLGLPLTYYVFIGSLAGRGTLRHGAEIVAHGQWRRTWVNVRIAWYRVKAVGRRLGGEDRIEAEVQGAERRKNCIPFAAMMAVGLFGTLIWLFYLRGQ